MKKNNKGFSLVELIIVIAIMAILAGAIAPALIRYIDKSRKSSDVTSAKAIVTAVETALSDNDDANAYLTAVGKVTLTPGDTSLGLGDVSEAPTGAAKKADDSIMATLKKVPSFKYKKANTSEWIVTISTTEIVTCYAADDAGNGIVLAPDGNVDDYDKDSLKAIPGANGSGI